MKGFWPKGKMILLLSIILIYASIGIGVKWGISKGFIEKSAPTLIEIGGLDEGPELSSTLALNLESAQNFLEKNMVRENGHVDLYVAVGGNANFSDTSTNSEAMSYYMLWAAQEEDRQKFDNAFDYVNANMLHPKEGYMMWKISHEGKITEEGSNIATDADLRAIKALLIAEKQWKDPKYTGMIQTISSGIKKVGITKDGYLAPYGGGSGEGAWTADEVWLSYVDFNVIQELSRRFGEPYKTLYEKMKEAILDAQIHNGLYNSMLTEKREYGNGIDGSGYSINSMWIMVRNAESTDPQLRASANKSLEFYKQKFEIDSELFSSYSSNGDALSPTDTPWVYALVGRAAVALDDYEFASRLMQKLVSHQVTDEKSKYYGAFLEGYGNDLRVGQFTMQESIITMQDYLKNNKQKTTKTTEENKNDSDNRNTQAKTSHLLP